jgi:hypothetical protein
VAFSPDSRSVACRDSYSNEKAFDVSSGAALPGAPRWEPCLGVERGCARGRAARIVRIHRFAAVVPIVRLLVAVGVYLRAWFTERLLGI